MKAFLKITLIAIKDNFITFILVYLCLPIFFVGYNGFLQKDKFKAETNEKTISVFLDDEDKTFLSEQLIGTLNSNSLKDFIQIEDETNAKYKIKIPKAITASGQSKELMDKYLNIQKESSKPIGKTFMHPALHSMSSYEAYAISISIFLFFMFVMEILNPTYKKKAADLTLRINSMPKKAVYIFNAQIISLALKVFVAITIYLLIFRLLRVSFMGNPILLLIYAASFSLVTGCIACSLVSINKQELVYTIVIIIFFR